MVNGTLRYIILGVLRNARRPLTAEEIRRELERCGFHIETAERLTRPRQRTVKRRDVPHGA